MKLDLQFGNEHHQIDIPYIVPPIGELIRFAIDGRTIEADAIEVAKRIYSIRIDGRSVEIRVEPWAGSLRVSVGGGEYTVAIRDPRKWERNRSATNSAEGRQSVVAPMPGKVVRLLVKKGETVKAGQGLAVVEAMKMQNEVRSPKAGVVERLPAEEGRAVNAGDTIAVIA